MPALDQLAAEQFASQTPPEALSLFQPIIDTIKPIIGIASAVLGGLFGLYLIFVLSRLYFERRKVRLLKDIRYDLDYLNQHFNLPYSGQKKFRKKIIPLKKWKEQEKVKEKNKEKKKSK